MYKYIKSSRSGHIDTLLNPMVEVCNFKFLSRMSRLYQQQYSPSNNTVMSAVRDDLVFESCIKSLTIKITIVAFGRLTADDEQAFLNEIN